MNEKHIHLLRSVHFHYCYDLLSPSDRRIVSYVGSAPASEHHGHTIE
eukprot:COSAG06_NODE_5422_length_3492_cov_2.015915_3_plen_47_part_00